MINFEDLKLEIQDEFISSNISEKSPFFLER